MCSFGVFIKPSVPFFNAVSEEPRWYVILSIAVVQPRLYLQYFLSRLNQTRLTTALVSLIQPRLITFFLLVHFNALGHEYHFFKTILEKLRSKWESLPYKNENVKKCQIWCFYVKRRHRRTLISCNLHLQHHNTIIVAVHKGGGKENFN